MTRNVALRVASLSTVAAPAGPAEEWLGAGETVRLAAMGSQQRRRQFIAGHWLARETAAAFTDTRPEDWLLEQTSHGAPELLQRGARMQQPIHVSLSHSGEAVAVAVAAFPVGIDLESAGRDRDWLALADHVFAPPECERLRQLPAADLAELFYRYWTLKEARGKRDGDGLRIAEARRQCARACDEPEAIAITWQFDRQCLALVGERGMRTSARGIPAAARQCFWQIDG